MSEVRLETIEIKITDLEHSVQELSTTVYQQQKQIDQLRALCDSLAGYVRDLTQAGGEGGPVNERPPHY
jgi:SlyX protein